MYPGPHHKLTGKIPKSFHKHYDVASPAQGPLGQDAALVVEQGGHLEAEGAEARALGQAVCLQLPSKVAAETVFFRSMFAPVSSTGNKWSVSWRGLTQDTGKGR